MLKIIVDNKEIYIRKETSIQLEVSNSIFSTEKTEGEVVFTFDVPAEQNDLIFNHARFVYVKRMKKYSCRIEVGGYLIGKGDLYIQKATSKNYSIGIVVNPFPENFQEKKLNENDFGSDIIISESSNYHKQSWMDFLRTCLNEDSNIKFPLFLDTEFYGDANQDFGFYMLDADLTAEDDVAFKASLSEDDLDIDREYVNRVFFDASGNILEKPNSRGIRIFNRTGKNKMNSFCFAPAIRLVEIVKKVYENAGYKVVGNFTADEFAKRQFMQSLRALDATPAQFDIYNTSTDVIFVTPVIHSNDQFAHTNINNIDISMKYKVGEDTFSTFRNSQNSVGASGVVKIRTYIPDSMFEDDSENFIKYRLAFLIVNESEPLPNACYPNINKAVYWPPINQNTTNFPTNKGGFFKIFGDGTLGSNFGWDGAGFYELNINFNTGPVVFVGQIQSIKYKFLLVKVGLSYNPLTVDQTYFDIISWQQFVPSSDFDLQFYIHNNFAKKFNLSECMPNLTNEEFTTEVCNFFGLAKYIDSTKKEVEFSFIRDILKSPKSLDLSKYCITNEAEIEVVDEKEYKYSISSTLEETNPDNVIEPCQMYWDLPDAKINLGKFCFVISENVFYEAKKLESETENFVYGWRIYSGNTNSLVVGSGDKTELKSKITIPYLQKCGKYNTLNLVPVIPKKGYSTIFNSAESSDFEMILLSYYNNEKFWLDSYSSYVYKECFRPTLPDQSPSWALSLTSTGEKSIGETLISPWLDLLSSYEKVNYKFSIPISVFFELISLLKPQEKDPDKQTRFVFVNGSKLIPIKMVFQFNLNSENILVEIEFAKQNTKI